MAASPDGPATIQSPQTGREKKFLLGGRANYNSLAQCLVWMTTPSGGASQPSYAHIVAMSVIGFIVAVCIFSGHYDVTIVALAIVAETGLGGYAIKVRRIVG